MNIHVPKNVDVVFLEYNQNDSGHVSMGDVQRRCACLASHTHVPRRNTRTTSISLLQVWRRTQGVRCTDITSPNPWQHAGLLLCYALAGALSGWCENCSHYLISQQSSS